MLRKTASPVASFGKDLKRLAVDMVETMYEHNGIGLAGPQIGLSKRLFIAAEVDKSLVEDEDEDAPAPQTAADKRERWGVVAEHLMVNPQIVARGGAQTGFDGCLSLPGLYVEGMERADTVTVRYQDAESAWHERVASGHFAWVIQHEYDHLEGVFFFDRLPEADKRGFLEEHRGDLAQMQRDARAFLKDKGAPVPVLS